MGFAFKMDITGNMAGQLAPINRGLKDADQNLEKVGRASRGVSIEWGNMFKSFAGLRRDDRGWTFNLSEGLAAVASLAASAGRAVFDLGKSIVQTAAKTQDLNLATRLQLGEGGAAMLQRVADSFANTRFDDDAIKQALLPLANAGIRDAKMLDDIATAAVDISTRFNTGEGGFQAATEALGKIALKREVGARQLEALGLNETDYFKNLSSLLGSSVERVKKQVAAGKVAAPTLLSVALDELAKQQGGELGLASLAGGKTLGATLQRLADLPGNLFKTLSDSPALAKFQQTLDGFIATLQGPTGTAIMERLGNALNNFLSTITPERLVGAFEGLVAAFQASIPVMEALGKALMFVARPLIGQDGETVRTATGATVRKGAGVQPIVGGSPLALPGDGETSLSIPAWIDKTFGWGPFAKEQGKTVGSGYGAGISQGIAESTATVSGAGSAIADAAVTSTTDAFQQHSPSRIGVGIGSNFVESIALGMEGSTSDVEAASRSLLGAAVPDGFATGGLGGGAAPVVNQFTVGDIIVNTAATDPRDIGHAVAIEIRRTLRDLAAGAGADV